MVIAQGSFVGLGGHVLEGGFSFQNATKGTLMETSSDFLFDGAAEPGWVLCSDVPLPGNTDDLERYARLGRFSNLSTVSDFPYQEVRGTRRAFVPSWLDVETARCVLLWCFKTATPLGMGCLKPATPSPMDKSKLVERSNATEEHISQDAAPFYLCTGIPYW